MAQKKPFIAKYGLDVGSNTVFSNNNILHANNTINNYTITSDMLARTGTPTGTFGSASKVPVITVDADGRVTNVSNTNVAGVTALTYTSANNTLKIDTADGSNFTATINQSEWDNYMTVANAQALIVSVVANTLSTANATLGFDNRMLVANTRALYTTLVGNTFSTANASALESSLTSSIATKMSVANTQALYNTLVGNTFSTANASALETSLNASIATKMSAANTRALYTTLQSNTTLLDTKMSVANTRTLANARLGATASVTLTGDVSGSASFSSNAVSITTQLEDDVSTARLSVNNYINFATGLESEDVPHAEGRVYYNDEYKALTVYNDESDVSLQVGQEEWIRVYNNTGSSIIDGTPVYATGATGETATVAPADATTEVKSRVLGLATHTIENASYGYVTVRGLVSGFDTSHLAAGQPVHVGANGSLQTSAPTYPYFPTDIGGCVVSDDTNGYVYVRIEGHTFEQLRITGNQHIDGNLTIDGDLTVTGDQSTISQSSLSVDDSFVYLNSGDTVANTGFTGTGLNDADFTGHYEGTTSVTYYVEIDGVGTGSGGVDTFKWSKDNFSTTEASTVDIDTDGVALDNGISITFNAATGHTSGDQWQGDVAPVNVDSGWFSNRNTGASGVGYTHMGIFFDVSDNKFKVVEEYDPEPEGTINTGDASYNEGTIVADTFEGNLNGNVTGDVTGNASTATALATARDITLSGDVTGSASFDGTSNITITSDIASSGTPTGTFGSGSLVPVITVGADGRITNISNTSVAGVSAFAYTAANTTFKIDTADGSNFTATIDVLKSTDSFANNDTQLLTAAAITDRIVELLPRIYNVANTQVFP
jgi:hypothetical protein